MWLAGRSLPTSETYLNVHRKSINFRKASPNDTVAGFFISYFVFDNVFLKLKNEEQFKTR